jgi:transposase
MTVFGTSDRLVSCARRCPQAGQSGTKTSAGKAGKGNPYVNGVLGKSPPQPAGPTPFSARATAAWAAAAASAKP